MERETLTKELTMINQFISSTVDNTKNMAASKGDELIRQFAKTEIRTKGPLTLEEKVPSDKISGCRSFNTCW